MFGIDPHPRNCRKRREFQSLENAIFLTIMLARMWGPDTTRWKQQCTSIPWFRNARTVKYCTQKIVRVEHFVIVLE